MNTDQDAHGVIVPPVAHRCRPPMTSREFQPPGGGSPLAYDTHPPVGSVWACSCGSHWRVEPPRQYVNLVSFESRWERCSSRAYRKVAKRGHPL